ncbi:ABC transporter ATP-binding protein [Rhizobium sp. P007]|jgi:branched-chain amino acid transport system ATP-binding protein|uniref:ABC transporter ATP-binding protein n=1 Tax=Rhizobium sp. P007 TaxID=285908 RepID=UPI00115A401D|nr:ABC transporter ATP-binding protein [Rhizobium sp. P007]CAD7045504.1 ABC transporter ATP-binding protein [Rhizobium sp. P007]
MPLLELKKLSVGYARTTVLNRIDLTLAEGEIVTLVGANGAGKSTIAKVISGILKPFGGEILLEGQPLAGLSAADRLRRGIAHVPEGRQIFGGMSVIENLVLGAYSGGKEDHAVIEERIAFVCRLFPVLEKRLGDIAGNFSGGQQQMLAIARGLMSKPRILVLDEPSLGVAPLLVAEIFALIGRLRDEGITILLAEQNARQALAIADRGYVLENGTITMSGPARELAASADIAERYLGVGVSTAAASDESDKAAVRLRALIA